MEEAIKEFVDSYINGNISHVINSLRRIQGDQRAYVTLEIFCKLHDIKPEIGMAFRSAIARDCAAHLD